MRRITSKKYLVVTSADLSLVLPQRAHHLISYLCETERDTTVVYRTVTPSSSLKDELSATRGKQNLTVFPVLFPLNKLFDPLFILLLLLRLLFVKGRKYDVGISLNLPAGILCTILRRIGFIKRFVYEDMDYAPGFFSSTVAKAAMSAAEFFCMKNSDLIVSTSLLLCHLRRRQGLDKAIWIPNGAKYEMFRRARKSRPHAPTMVYAGHIHERCGIELPLRALRSIHTEIPDARYLIVGDGPYLPTLKDLTRKMNLDGYVEFAGRVRHGQLPAIFSESDAGIATFRSSDLMKFVFPLKVTEYMSAGLPVIVTKGGETEEIVRRSRAGCAINYSAKEFASAFVKMFKDKIMYQEFARNATVASRRYDWNCLFRKEFDAIDSL